MDNVGTATVPTVPSDLPDSKTLNVSEKDIPMGYKVTSSSGIRDYAVDTYFSNTPY